MGSEARVDEVRPAIEDRLGGNAHLTTALPGMLEVLVSRPAVLHAKCLAILCGSRAPTRIEPWE